MNINELTHRPKNFSPLFSGINVLDDSEIRDGIKKFSDWPTIPQLYIKGEFVGGCDIIKEMFEKGELQKLFLKLIFQISKIDFQISKTVFQISKTDFQTDF